MKTFLFSKSALYNINTLRFSTQIDGLSVVFVNHTSNYNDSYLIQGLDFLKST